MPRHPLTGSTVSRALATVTATVVVRLAFSVKRSWSERQIQKIANDWIQAAFTEADLDLVETKEMDIAVGHV
jgi:hypothetical protein